MKNLIIFENFVGESTNFSNFINEKRKKKKDVSKPEEVPVAEEIKAEGPNEKLFTGASIDRETAKKKAREQAKREGYNYETAKSQLKGTQDDTGKIISYNYQIVMKKEM